MHVLNTSFVFWIMLWYNNWTAQKISPDTKEKVQLQLIMHDGGANTFQLNHPGGRTSQLADRDSVKELLLHLLPKFRRKLSSELEEKNRYYEWFRIESIIIFLDIGWNVNNTMCL